MSKGVPQKHALSGAHAMQNLRKQSRATNAYFDMNAVPH